MLFFIYFIGLNKGYLYRIKVKLMSEIKICLFISVYFRWRWRQRIQVTMSGQHINDDPIELHDQQLVFPEHRFTEHVGEDEQV